MSEKLTVQSTKRKQKVQIYFIKKKSFTISTATRFNLTKQILVEADVRLWWGWLDKTMSEA